MRVIHAVKISAHDSMGIYRAVRELAIGQAQLGADVHIVAQGQWPNDDLRSAGVILHEGDAIAGLRKLRNLAGGDTVVHTHLTWTPLTLAPSLAFSSRRNRPLFVISPHGSLAHGAMAVKGLKKQLAWRLVFRRALRRYDLIAATSAKEEAEIDAWKLGVPTVVLPNPVPAPDAELGGQVAKSSTVGFLGRLHPIKGVKELLQAWKEISPKHPGWRLKLVGPAEQLDYVTELRELARNDSSIELCDAVFGGERWRFLAGCEIIAVPSKTENFCYVVAEALLAGTPVVASMGVPWPELEEHQLGWRGEGDVSALAEMIDAAILAGATERARMGRRGADYVRRSFSITAVAERALRMYQASQLRLAGR